MGRHSQWELRLSSYFAEVANKPFAWGEHDCSLFAAGAVAAMTGEDFAADYRGTYSDADGAKAVLAQLGVKSLRSFVNQKLGKSKHIAFAKRGDVVIYNGALGICCGSFSRFVGSVDEAGVSFPADGSEGGVGLVPIPTRSCQRCWEVPF